MIIESFSPFMRRVLALGLLLLALILAHQLLVVPVIGAVEGGRRELVDTRYRLARLLAIAEGPIPPAPPASLQSQLLHAPDKAAAEARLVALLRDLARRQGLRFDGAPIASKEPGAKRQVRIEIAVEGPSDALTLWIYAIESGDLVLRFERADYESNGQAATPARLVGELRAIWATGR